MPLSLKSEIALYSYSDLISKVKLFELSEPSFLMGIVRAFKSEIYLIGDYIIRYQDFANSMYFIEVGTVEVIATDNQSTIAILDEGCYFGEIGVLMNCLRTVYVKSLTLVILASIDKSDLLFILSNFPEHLEFLLSIAGQRIKTCNKEDINVDHELIEDNFSSTDSDHSDELETPEYYAAAEHSYKSCWLKFVTTLNSKAKKGDFMIDPLSNFSNIWTLLILFSYIFYLGIIPYSIAFTYKSFFIQSDVVCYVLFVADNIINYNTALITEYKSYIHDKDKIYRNYMNKYIIFDILSILPCD